MTVSIPATLAERAVGRRLGAVAELREVPRSLADAEAPCPLVPVGRATLPWADDL
ncbi:hypothetical protein [Amycolatopsis sp.]|jgi:hypothetical protein|uniref:hypothetical protein n=1 Tax=Amycolatopsis sp. TaxID=37632 RepID=UPI002E076446|nr:hypothetical protein [Amycolatopsis sp.]